MPATSYRGLPEFGLPLITKDHPSFDRFVDDIGRQPAPGPSAPSAVSDRAAVLVNDSGHALIAVDWFWRYTRRDGNARTSRFSTLGSSVQRDVLSGRSKVGRDLGTFILPGSKRLITEQGIFGSNLDVLTPEELPHASGYCGGWGGGSGRESAATELAAVELVLDFVILEDGLCAGPDESAMFEALNESLDVQRTAAREAVRLLTSGASVGQVFEVVRPLARHDPGPRCHTRAMLATFGNEAVRRLIDANEGDLLAFFERAAEPRSLELRRPGVCA